jgi:chemotaxis protein MotB
MKMKRRIEISQDEGLWLISYSDLISSILAVLVLVMSFSKIDIEKVDHANRLLKDKSLMTLDEIQKNINQIIKDNNLTKYVHTLLNPDGLYIEMSSTLQFKTNSAKLDKEGIKKLKPLLEKIVQLSKKREIIISGHTDNTGDPKYNWELSAQRANSVMFYLMDKGLDYKHTHIVAYAANRQYKTDKNLTLEERRALNRRVSIIIGMTHKY